MKPMLFVTIKPVKPQTSDERQGIAEQSLVLAQAICASAMETFEVSKQDVTTILDERARLAHTLLLVLEKGLKAEQRVTDLALALEEREARIQQLLRAYVRLTNEQPFPEELRNWPAQRAALIAEVGTLRARLAELEARGD